MRAFPDAIAYGGWSLDLHPPEGVDVPDRPPFTPFGVPHIYDIPLRSCVSRSIDNLMFAGRNISATHVVLGSTRVMATCSVIGQGVGTAAAHAIKTGMSPFMISFDPKAINAIQQRLLRDDAYLIGRVNSDPLDLAQGERDGLFAAGERAGAERDFRPDTRCTRHQGSAARSLIQVFIAG